MAAKKAILVTGAGGQLGTALASVLRPEDMDVFCVSREKLDISDEAAVGAAIGARVWACVINCAAYTKVDAAEDDPAAAWQANALGPAILAKATRQACIPLIHISTDYVFDGSLQRPYRPSDPVCPANAYGRSKAAGEEAVRVENPRHVIVRTSWVVSPTGANFAKTMINLARQRSKISVVNDQFGRPTSALDLALAVQRIAASAEADPDGTWGTYHFANDGRLSWYDLAVAIMAGVRRRGAPAAEIVPIPTADYLTKARRPANSILCTADYTRVFGEQPRRWEPALEEILDRLLPQN
jgi:dTDP-4-dehydrorhamnose reductase